jgi:hypothetical protein
LKYSADLFDTSTIKLMAKHFETLLEEIIKNSKSRISDFLQSCNIPLVAKKVSAEKHDDFGNIREKSNLTDNQFFVWLVQKMNQGIPLYDMAETYCILGEIDVDKFKKTFQSLVNSSDAMRTIIRETDSVPYQMVIKNFPYEMEYLDFSLNKPSASSKLNFRVNNWGQCCKVLLYGLYNPNF